MFGENVAVGVTPGPGSLATARSQGGTARISPAARAIRETRRARPRLRCMSTDLPAPPRRTPRRKLSSVIGGENINRSELGILSRANEGGDGPRPSPTPVLARDTQVFTRPPRPHPPGDTLIYAPTGFVLGAQRGRTRRLSLKKESAVPDGEVGLLVRMSGSVGVSLSSQRRRRRNVTDRSRRGRAVVCSPLPVPPPLHRGLGDENREWL